MRKIKKNKYLPTLLLEHENTPQASLSTDSENLLSTDIIEANAMQIHTHIQENVCTLTHIHTYICT